MPSGSVPDATYCKWSGCKATLFDAHHKEYCDRHYRDYCNARRRERRANDANFRLKESSWRASRKEHKSQKCRERKQNDPAFLPYIAYRKRASRFRKSIQRICTNAYLSNAHREEYRYAVALRKWIKQDKEQKRQQAGIDPIEEKRAAARGYSKRRYWAEPEAHRLKSQAFKHTRPDYREQWNAKRGKLELELSDGTLTKESVTRLFAESTRCPYCGDQYKKSRRSLDHIVPLAKANGRKLHSISNVMVCCFVCNNKKRTKGINQFLEELKASSKKNAAEPREAGRILRLFAAND